MELRERGDLSAYRSAVAILVLIIDHDCPAGSASATFSPAADGAADDCHMTPYEAGAILALKAGTITRAIREGRLRAVRRPGSREWHVPVSAVMERLDERGYLPSRGTDRRQHAER